MSSHGSPVNELDQPPKRRIQRRHGACEPCRSSKTKCDGRMPCGACRSEKRRQCPCVYSEKAMKLQQVTAEIRRRAESEKRTLDETSRALSDDEDRSFPSDRGRDSVPRNLPVEDLVESSGARRNREYESSEFETESAKMSCPLSICAVVEEFKKLKPARGYSAQVVSRCDGFDVVKHTPTMQQLRATPRPFPDTRYAQISPSLECVQGPSEVQALGSKLEAVDNWIREGYLSRAWVDLGSIVREAQLIQDTTSNDQALSDPTSWRPSWHNVLDIEAQLGLTLGQPTCAIASKGTKTNTKSDNMLLEDSLDDTKTDLYQHIHGMLSLNLSNPTAIRDFLEQARAVLHHEPFNQIGLCTTNEHPAAVRDLHLNTHMLFMVIFCRMAGLCDLFSRDLTNLSWSETPAADIIRSLSLHQPRQKLAYCRRMFRSANFILDSFFTLYQNSTELSGRHWTRCHSAYIAAIILGIAKLRHEVEWHVTTEKLKRLERLFSRLSQADSSCYLFSSAVERLRDLNSVKEPASEATRNKHTGIKNRKRNVPHPEQTSPEGPHHRNLGSAVTSSPVSPVVSSKRRIDMVDEPIENNAVVRERFMHDPHVQEAEEYQTQVPPNTSFEGLDLEHLALFQDNSADYSQSSGGFTNSSASSSATSFSESEMPLQAVCNIPLNHPGPPFAYPFPFATIHPPMAWNNPIYTVSVVDDQNAGPLSLGIPAMSQYSTDTSPLVTGAGQQYNLLHNSSSKASAIDSHQSSPLQVSSEGSTRVSNTSPSVQAESSTARVDLTQIGSANRSFLHQVNTPLQGSGPPSSQIAADRSSSSDTIRQSPSPTHNNRQQPQIGWQPTAAVPMPHDLQNQYTNTNLALPNIGPRPETHDTRSQELQSRPHHEERMFYPQSVAQPSLGILAGQFIPPDQMAYLNQAQGMFESQQLQGHYPQSHLPPYQKYYVTDPGQLHEQWRRMSIDTGGAAGNQF